jgi:hypothetical protein
LIAAGAEDQVDLIMRGQKPLSFREVEEMFLQRGVDVSYETIRRWVAKFGPRIALGLRRRQPRPGDIWHLDEVVVKIWVVSQIFALSLRPLMPQWFALNSNERTGRQDD